MESEYCYGLFILTACASCGANLPKVSDLFELIPSANFWKRRSFCQIGESRRKRLGIFKINELNHFYFKVNNQNNNHKFDTKRLHTLQPQTLLYCQCFLLQCSQHPHPQTLLALLLGTGIHQANLWRQNRSLRHYCATTEEAWPNGPKGTTRNRQVSFWPLTGVADPCSTPRPVGAAAEALNMAGIWRWTRCACSLRLSNDWQFSLMGRSLKPKMV